MPRPRTNRLREALPDNLYERKGYYSWRDPATGGELGLGRDRLGAIAAAEYRNAKRTVERYESTRQGIALAPLARDARGLLDADGIIARGQPRSHISGIYFLMLGGAIVYVGQSTHLHARIAAHSLTTRAPWFDAYFSLEAPPDQLDELEAAYIAKFNPERNIRRPADTLGTAPRAMVSEMIRMSFEPAPQAPATY